MSHITTIQGASFTDLTVFDKALEFFKGTRTAATKFNYWGGRTGACEFKVSFPHETHEIGLARDAKTGAYRVDFDAMTVGHLIGQRGEILQREYALQAAVAVAQKQGKRTSVRRVKNDVFLTVHNVAG